MRGNKLNLRRIFWVLVMVLHTSEAHCAPGSEWELASTEDDGANTYTTAYINVSYVDPKIKRYYVEKSEIGKYGDGRIGSAEGVLVHVSSPDNRHTGCELPLRSTLGDGSIPKEPWIALIKRGQCSFEVKIENAYKHNAAAVLVYNDRESPILDKMKLDPFNTGTRNISAIFTYKWKGEQLAKLVDNGSRVMMHVTVATRCTRSNTHVNRTSVLFVSISFVVLMLISMAWLVFYYVQRFRYMHAKERLSKRLCNAAKKALSKIPTKEIRQEDSEVQGDGECCAVCIEPYKVTDDLRILPCSHEFHKICIDPWLLEHRTCPMCKMDILKHYGFEYGKSQEDIIDVDIERDGNIQQALATSEENGSVPREEEEIIADFQVLAIRSEIPDESVQICQQCRCQAPKMGKPSQTFPSLLNKESELDTAKLLPLRQDDSSNKRNSSQNESNKYIRSRNECPGSNEDTRNDGSPEN